MTWTFDHAASLGTDLNAGTANARSLAISVTAGDLLVCATSTRAISGTGITVSVTDSQGNAWTQVNSYQLSGNTRVSLWWATASATGTNTIGATPSASCVMQTAVSSWKISGTIAVDSSSTGSGTSTTYACGTTTVSGSGELYVGVAIATVSTSMSAGGGFTLRTSGSDATNSTAIGLIDALNVSTNQSGTLTGTSGAYLAYGASFSVSGSTIATTLPLPMESTAAPSRSTNLRIDSLGSVSRTTQQSVDTLIVRQQTTQALVDILAAGGRTARLLLDSTGENTASIASGIGIDALAAPSRLASLPEESKATTTRTAPLLVDAKSITVRVGTAMLDSLASMTRTWPEWVESLLQRVAASALSEESKASPIGALDSVPDTQAQPVAGTKIPADVLLLVARAMQANPESLPTIGASGNMPADALHGIHGVSPVPITALATTLRTVSLCVDAFTRMAGGAIASMEVLRSLQKNAIIPVKWGKLQDPNTVWVADERGTIWTARLEPGINWKRN